MYPIGSAAACAVSLADLSHPLLDGFRSGSRAGLGWRARRQLLVVETDSVAGSRVVRRHHLLLPEDGRGESPGRVVLRHPADGRHGHDRPDAVLAILVEKRFPRRRTARVSNVLEEPVLGQIRRVQLPVVARCRIASPATRRRAGRPRRITGAADAVDQRADRSIVRAAFEDECARAVRIPGLLDFDGGSGGGFRGRRRIAARPPRLPRDLGRVPLYSNDDLAELFGRHRRNSHDRTGTHKDQRNDRCGPHHSLPSDR